MRIGAEPGDTAPNDAYGWGNTMTGGSMPASGEVYLRADGSWGFRIRASDGVIVADDAGRHYETREEARSTLERVMRGDFNGPIELVGSE